MKAHHENEALLFSIDAGQAESFLKQRGLKMLDHMDHKEIEKSFLSYDNGSLIGEMTGLFRFAMGSPIQEGG